MEARLITAVKELDRCLICFLWKLACGLDDDMYISSGVNNGNMCVGNMAYQFMVSGDLCLWNGELNCSGELCCGV
jgi:hypothetical protein